MEVFEGEVVALRYHFSLDPEREQVRTFALPLMRKVRLTATQFELPKDFPIAAHLKGSFGVFHPSANAKTRKVRILFDGREGQTARSHPAGREGAG